MVFSISDHVGTQRVVFDCDGQVIERNDHYAFGLRHPGWSSVGVGSSDQRYAFAGGTRTADEMAIAWQVYGARVYDPVLGRFLGVEPLADEYSNVSVYAYSLNDPVNLSDPSGLYPGGPAPGESFDSWWLYQFSAEKASNDFWNRVDVNLGGGGGGGGGGRWVEETTTEYRWWWTGTRDRDGNLSIHRWDLEIVTKTSRRWVSNPNWSGLMIAMGPSREEMAVGVCATCLQKQEGKQQAPVIDNTDQANNHYYKGKGQAVKLGPNTIKAALSNRTFLEKQKKIIEGKTTLMKGDFGIDLTASTITFHVGRTNVDYEITCDASTCRVDFTIFSDDGYWDPNFILEMTGLQKPDGKGPNLEFNGGTPYSYSPHLVSVVFPNPGYKPNKR